MANAGFLEFPFNPFESARIWSAIVSQWPAFAVELGVLLILTAKRAFARGFGSHGRGEEKEVSGWCALPFFAWGLLHSYALHGSLSMFHPQEIFVWFVMFETAIGLGVIVLVQGLTVAALFPRLPSLALSGSSKASVFFVVLAVLLDSFTAIHTFRV